MKESNFSKEANEIQPEKKGIMQRIRDYKKAIAFVALMELVVPAFLSGAEKDKESAKGKETEISEVENVQKNLSIYPRS